MSKITTIEELNSALNQCAIDHTESCYLNVMKRIDIDISDWEGLFSFNDERPSRICLSSNDDYQLFLTCWEKGQQGPIHDIDSEEAWIHPITGQFIEERYRLTHDKKKLEQVSSVILTSQSYSYMNKSETIYRYKNNYESRSICLHLYSKPITEWKEYDLETAQSKKVPHTCDVII